MTKGQTVLTIVLMITSLQLFISSIVWMISRAIKKKKTPEKYNKVGVSTALAFSGFLLLSIWLLRFAVGYFTVSVSENGTARLTPLEELVNSLFGAFRTFRTEDEYAEYIINIKALITQIVPNTHWSFSTIRTAVVVYASMLHIIAPIVGGAIILEVLASIFPRIGLRWSYLFRRRHKYYFSELNAASLSLAKSIYDKRKNIKPTLIFTDTYVDDENEKEYELLVEAKRYGAICVRDDLLHIPKNGRGKRTYFLMDENELGNLQTLLGLTEDHNIRYTADAEIFLFVQSDAYVMVENQINKKFKEERITKLLKGGRKPTIIPINGYRNLIQNLFVEVPLYESLIGNKDSTNLSVTIFGNGSIGTEAFLNAYWMGQMMISRDDNGVKSMSECEMTINVVSKDTEKVFWSKIDYVNPEIKETVQLLEKNYNINKSELLCYNDRGERNNPYCKVRYKEADVMFGGFLDDDSEEIQQILDSDYFIVSLGNDADNISLSEKLKCIIGKKHIEDDSAIDKKSVIAYAVYNSNLVKVHNTVRRYQCRDNDKTDIYMYAFGSLDRVYSYDNIYMSRHRSFAEAIGASYNESQIHKVLISDNEGRNNDENGNYKYWMSLARAMHIKYKAFSLGLIDKSVFSYKDDGPDTEKVHAEYVAARCKKYVQLALAESSDSFNGEISDVYDDARFKRHLLAWIEHRRWNAFTRIMGYQYASAETLFKVKNSQKDTELKLHSCLVEARRPHLEERDTYIYAEFTANGLVDVNTTFVSFSTKQLDRLDQVSYERKKRNPTEPVDDFKMNDYYRYEFYGYSDFKNLDHLLQ